MPSWWRRELQYGDTGPDVEVVQRKLRCWTSGVYDVETQARVRAVQKRVGRPMTGSLDRETAEALGELATASLRPAWYKSEIGHGARGADVAELRRMLGLREGNFYDQEAEEAVRRFQSSLRIWPDGICDLTVAIALGSDVPLSQT